MKEMDDEFDDNLDDLCSQIDINICNEPVATQNENVFKKPMYSFNRVQQNRTFNSFQNSQASSALQSQTDQQNRLNQISTGPSRSNQAFGPQKQQPANRPLNGQPSNQRLDTRATSTNANQSKPNQFIRPAAQSATFVKPSAPPLASNNLNNQNPSVPANPGNAPFSNLNKSLAAQNRNRDCYSINKQFIVSSPSRKFQGKASGPNQPGKPALLAGCKPRSDYGVQQRAMVSSLSSTIRSTQTVASSQFQVTIPSSQSTNRSSFNITNNVSAEVTVKQQLNSLKIDNDGLDPSDKYLGKIEMLQAQMKKREAELKKELDEKEELKKQLQAQKESFERRIEAMQTAQFFDDSARMTRGFTEEMLNTQVDKTSPILNRTISSTTYQLKKPSPRKRTSPRKTATFSAFPSQSVPIPNFDPNDDLADLSLNLEENDEFIIPETQIERPSNHQANDLDESDSDLIIPETQIPAQHADQPAAQTEQFKVVHQPVVHPAAAHQTTCNRTEFELSVMPPTQLENETVHYKIEAAIESDDDVPASQMVGDQPLATADETVRVRKSRSIPSCETKRMRIREAITQPDDAVFHQPRFKFVDYDVYDSMYEDNRMNIFLENINPIFDRIVEKILSLNLLNSEEELASFEYKYSKLNEQSVLTLVNLEFSSRIPEFTFNLLSNLNRKPEYTGKLAEPDLLFRLTSKCGIVEASKYTADDGNPYENHRTLFNKMFEIFSKCRIIAEGNARDYYLRLCYSIILFLIEHTVEQNTFIRFHDCPNKKTTCWQELLDVLSQFALYMLDIFDEKSNLHELIVQDLTKFVLALIRTKKPLKGTIGSKRLAHFAHKMSAKMKYSTKVNYLDYLYPQ